MLSWETSPNISANLLHPPNFGSESKNKVYSSRLHCPVEALVIFLIVRYLLLDATSSSIHYFVILSMRKS